MNNESKAELAETIKEFRFFIANGYHAGPLLDEILATSSMEELSGICESYGLVKTRDFHSYGHDEIREKMGIFLRKIFILFRQPVEGEVEAAKAKAMASAEVYAEARAKAVVRYAAARASAVEKPL